jgi:mono/diheme cytochrome c family protein
MIMKLLKWIAIALGSLIIILVVAAAVLGLTGGARINKEYSVQVRTITIPTDEASLDRGDHLVQVYCTSCHGDDLRGEPIFDEPSIARVVAPNITGLSENHDDSELILAIRHGLEHDGRPLMIMPADVFLRFSPEDLGSVIAYLKTVAAADGDPGETEVAFIGKIMMQLGLFGDLFPAETIDHDLPYPARPPIGPNPEYGAYLAPLCQNCHGEDLAGDQPPDPASPPAPNLTPGGRLVAWSEADFLKAVQTGITPDGRQMDNEFMPFEVLGRFHEEELQALWIHLQSLEPAPSS